MTIESWLVEPPMTAEQIKARLIEREGSIEAVAKRIREPRTQVSATINYLRLNLNIRRKLIRQYGVRFSPYYGPASSGRNNRRPKAEEVECAS